MPSSLIFTGLVVLWLLILVPAVARHQQEVARPSGASLAGRVLDRPRRRIQARRTGRLPIEEGDSVDPERLDQDDAPTAREPERPWVSAARAARLDEAEADEHDDDVAEPDRDPEPDVAEPDRDPEPDVADSDDDESDVRWERPPPRYRPGRGGYDPEADAETARARYAFRQRVVLLLLVCALLTGIAAAAAFPVVWWAHGAIDAALVVYLVYLRRQVRLEAAIRERRAARMAGTRRTQAADDRDLDEWARRGREVTRRPSAADDDAEADEAEVEVAEVADTWVDEDDDTTRVRGVGEPVGLLPARRRGVVDESAEPETALPPLQPTPPPPIPPGTSLVVVDDDELDLHDLGTSARAPHRSAVGE